MARWVSFGAPAGAVLCLCAPADGGPAAEGTLSLEIAGAEGARYADACTLTTAAGERTFNLSGVVPYRTQFTGLALACRIDSAGPIAVAIVRDGRRSRSATSGGTVRIRALR